MRRADKLIGLICLLSSLTLGWAIYSSLMFRMNGLPVVMNNILSLGGWIMFSVLLIVSAPVGLRKSRNVFLLAGAFMRLLLGLGGIVSFCLLTDVGILFVGHKYWISRAFESPTAIEAQACVEVVLRSTQYGKEVAATAIEALPDGLRRRELLIVIDR